MTYRKTLLLVSIAFLIPASAALSFDVQIDALVNSTEYNTEFQKEGAVQKVNTTVQNSGSIGCKYRLRGDFSYKNETFQRYSEPYTLFPGAEEVMEIHFIAENYTGQVDAKIYNEYCGKEKQILGFNYTMSERVLPNQTVESRVVSVDDEGSEIQVDLEKGRLVPQETPPYWKAGSARVNNSQATITYDPPIFREGEELSYTVLDTESNVVGRTTVKLQEPEKTTWEHFKQGFPLVVLIVSIAINFAFVLKRLENTRK